MDNSLGTTRRLGVHHLWSVWVVLFLVIRDTGPQNVDYDGRSIRLNKENFVCHCGIGVNPSERIVGGVDTNKHEFPWHAALLTPQGKMYCGATLINDRYVLTAAHCVADLGPGLSVLLGEHYYSYSSPLRIGIVSTVIHPKYQASEFFNDIAILRLAERIAFSRTVQPVCLPRPGLKYDGTMPTVIGWGYTSETGGFPTVLQKVQMPIIPLSRCIEVYGEDGILPSMLCASWPKGKQDSCTGDSGGPLLLEQNSRWNLIGIVSFGHGCARPEYPATYTRVDKYLSWIQANTRDAVKCGN